MHKFKSFLAGVTARILLPLMLVCLPACMLHKVATVTQDPNTGLFSTNVVTQVNTNNLILDAGLFQGGVAVSVSCLVAKDPSVIAPLKTAQTALDGILNGSNPQTIQQVLNMLKAQNNPALTAEVTSLVNSASSLEQSLLQKYGASVAGQITTALAKAANAGIIIGLAGH